MARRRYLTKTSSQLASLSSFTNPHTKCSAIAAATTARSIVPPATSISGCSLEEDAALIAALVRGTRGAERSFADRHDAFLRGVVMSSSPHAGMFVDDPTPE